MTAAFEWRAMVRRAAPIEIICEHTHTGLDIEFRYLGKPFTPTDRQPEVELTHMPEGGFAMYIIERACDQVAYRHHQGVNSVCLHIDGPA